MPWDNCERVNAGLDDEIGATNPPGVVEVNWLCNRKKEKKIENLPTNNIILIIKGAHLVGADTTPLLLPCP